MSVCASSSSTTFRRRSLGRVGSFWPVRCCWTEREIDIGCQILACDGMSRAAERLMAGVAKDGCIGRKKLFSF